MIVEELAGYAAAGSDSPGSLDPLVAEIDVFQHLPHDDLDLMLSQRDDHHVVHVPTLLQRRGQERLAGVVQEQVQVTQGLVEAEIDFHGA